MSNKYSISCHQTGVIAALLLLTLKLTSLPSLMHNASEFGAVLSIFIICLFNIGVLALIIWLKKKYNNMGLFDIISKFLGAFVARLIYFVFFAFFIFKLLALVDEGFGFIRDVVDEEFTYFNFIICFFPVICALAFSGIRNLARTTEFFYPFILIGVFVAIVFSFAPLNFFGLGSLSRLNFGTLTSTISELSFWNGDIFAMLIFVDKIDLKKGKIINIFSPIVIASIFLVVAYTMYYSLYQQTSILHVNMIFDIVEYSVGTSSGWHMDIFAIMVYIMCLFLQGGIYMFCAVKSAQKVFSFNNKHIIHAAIVLLLIIIQFLYLNDYLKYVIFAQRYLSVFTLILLGVVPILTLVAILIKGKKHERNGSKNKSII